MAAWTTHTGLQNRSRGRSCSWLPPALLLRVLVLLCRVSIQFEASWTDVQVEFARATATVLGNAIGAIRQKQDEEATRWLKFWRLFGQLMLRAPVRGGRRGHAILPARFGAFAQGDFKRLVDWWQHDRAMLERRPKPDTHNFPV